MQKAIKKHYIFSNNLYFQRKKLLNNNLKKHFKHTFKLHYQSLVFVGLAPTTKRVTTQAGKNTKQISKQ